ncbi:MAG: DUF1294 domain-containing protein [Clostridia bacterium]|nr:DUF1294 domain-containing protein [Clostridia bacterium]
MKKETLILVVLIWIAFTSLIGFFSMLIDKNRAKKHKWRISERMLFVFALIGGSLGSLIGMWLFRHKTKHWYFVVFIPLILVCQAVGLIFLMK